MAGRDRYKRRFASRILIAKTIRDPLETTFTRQLLLKLGVPAEAIVEFGDEVSSTYEEARAVLEWAKSRGCAGLNESYSCDADSGLRVYLCRDN